MDDEQQQPQSEERQEESTLLKLHEEFHQFMQECRDCRREIEAHWQFCAHCGIRLATHCPGCGAPVIRRLGFRVLESRLAPGGRCVYCDARIPGRWD